jgi:hypothetical protein
MNILRPAQSVVVPGSSISTQSPPPARGSNANPMAAATFFGGAGRQVCKTIPLIWLAVVSCAPTPVAYQTRPVWDGVNHRWVMAQAPVSNNSAYMRGAALAGANGFVPSGPPQVPATPRQYSPPPPPTPEMQKYSGMLAAAVQQDTIAWENKQLDRDSFHNFHVYDEGHGMCDNQCPEITRVYGEYTFNGGKVGYAFADIKTGHIACLLYEDTPGVCSPIRTAEDVRRMREEDARREAAIREEVLQHPRSKPSPSSGTIKLPGPSISFCNKFTTGSFMSGALGNPWCD